MAPPKTSTSSRRIPITNLDPATFAPFGSVVQNPATHDGSPKDVEKTGANQGSATKWLDVTHMQDWYHMCSSGKPAKVVTNMFVCKPRKLRQEMWFDVKILERHPFTPQMFVPIGLGSGETGTAYLVIVAPTLSLRSRSRAESLDPPYPIPAPRRKRSLRERLLGARPNPFTNDHTPSTTPMPFSSSSSAKPKGPGAPDLANLQAFIARGDQAVTYGPGTWHAPMVALGSKEIEFVVVQYANGVGVEDCQEIEIEVDGDGEGLSVDVGSGMEPGAIKAKL